MKQRMWMRAIGIAAVFSLFLCVPAYAASPGFPENDVQEEEELYVAADGNQISKEHLLDHVVEYEEIGSLIHENNPDVQKMVKSMEDTRQKYTEIRDYLRTERASAAMEKEDAKDEGDMEEYAENASLEEIYKSSVKNYNDMLKKLDRYSANKSRRILEKQLTNSAQNLMISLQAIRQQKSYMEIMEELYQAQYENTRIKQTAGLVSEQDVLSAYNTWMDMSVSLSSLEDSERSIYQNLFLLLGMEETEAMEFGDIPAVNSEYLYTLNLESDIQKAIGNHTEIINARNTSSGGSWGGREKKFRTLDELEEKLKIKMRQLYESIKQAKKSYDAAQNGYISAQIRWENAQRKQELGLLNEEEYLQEKIQYTRKKAAFEAADLSLFQALENYNWAVNGIAELD